MVVHGVRTLCSWLAHVQLCIVHARARRCSLSNLAIYLRIPKISQQFYCGRCHIVVRPKTSVEIGKSFRCWRILKLNFPLGKPYDVVAMASDICNTNMMQKNINDFLALDCVCVCHCAWRRSHRDA